MADKTDITITTKITLTSLEDAANFSEYFKEIIAKIVEKATVTISIRETSKIEAARGGG